MAVTLGNVWRKTQLWLQTQWNTIDRFYRVNVVRAPRPNFNEEEVKQEIANASSLNPDGSEETWPVVMTWFPQYNDFRFDYLTTLC